MSNPKGSEGFGGQARLLLPSCIEGNRALAGNPAADVLVSLSVSYQYHQCHGASFLWLQRLAGQRCPRLAEDEDRLMIPHQHHHRTRAGVLDNVLLSCTLGLLLVQRGRNTTPFRYGVVSAHRST